MKSHGRQNYIPFIALALLISAAFVHPALGEENSPKIRVAFPASPHLSEIYGDGTYGGTTYDWLTEISKYTGWEYEFVGGDSDELIDGMMEGRYDIMGGMFHHSGLDEYFNYPKYTMGSNFSLLLYGQENQEIKAFDLTTLEGKTIGVFSKAEDKIARLNQFLDFNNITSTLVYYDSAEDYEQCLNNREVDLMLGSDVYMQEGYNVAASFPSEPHYLVTAKGRPDLCQELNKAMEAIYSANPDFAQELYEKYYSDKYHNAISFTQEELDFIRQSPPVRVAVIRERYPLYYQEKGIVKGTVPASMELITEKTGLKFEYVYGDTYHEMQDLIARGEADILNGFLDSEAAAASLGMVRTAEYASFNAVILCNKQSFDTDQGMIMAMPQGQQLSPRRSLDSIRYYDNYGDCLNAVNRGEADYTQMPTAFMEDYFSKGRYANLVVAADAGIQEEVSIAMPRPVNVPLYSVLNKAINNFTPEEQQRLLVQDSLYIRENSLSLKTLIYSNPILAFCIFGGLILAFSATILLLESYRMREKIMKVRLEKAEETSKAKADFLSRMSHEIRTPLNAIIGLTGLTLMSGEAPPHVTKNLAQIDSSAKFLLSLLNDILDMSKIDNGKMGLNTAPFDLKGLMAQLESMFLAQARSKGISLTIRYNPRNSLFVGDEMRLKQVLANLLSNACKFTDRGGEVELSVSGEYRGEKEAKLNFSVRDTGAGIQAGDLERIFNAFEQAQNSNATVPGTGLGLAISSNLVQLMGGRLEAESRPGQGSTFHFSILLPVYTGDWEEEGKGSREPAYSLEGLHVLLAEDNAINAEIALELMKLQNISADWAVNGSEAVELFANSREGAYDVILMDINMPVKNGLTAASEIRAMDRADAASVPILAMTANTFQEDRDKAAEAGMTGFLPKPFDISQLYEILRHAGEGTL